MKGLQDDVIRELRQNASEGASVADLLRLILDRLGPEEAYGTTLVRYFMVAFQLPLRVVSPIGGWSSESGGEVTDARIQELIHPEILQRKCLWDRPESNVNPSTTETGTLLNSDDPITRN